MGEVLGGLKPAELWKQFEEITRYPRPSKHEEKIVEFVLNFAEENNLDYERDKKGNIIIRVPATKGMENKKTVVLQGHLDMVCEKNNDVEFDFMNDPIDVMIDGEWVTAKGTTLGSDNGIGIAAGLALTQLDDVQHGPVELLFTLDEETGLTGAKGLEPGMLEGKILLNLDSEEDGTFYIGCSGGLDTKGHFPFTKQNVSGKSAYRIDVKGLKGGHSGLEIHEGRGNAIKFLARALFNLNNDHGIEISEIEGGSKRNAIPREAYAVVLIDPAKEKDLTDYIEKYNAEAKAEIATVEPNLQITAVKANAKDAIDSDTKDNIINVLQGSYHGVIKMSAVIDDLVETSTNLATVVMKDDYVEIGTSQRSSVDSEIKEAGDMVASVFKLGGGKIKQDDGYPGWKPDVNSEILQISKKVYKDTFGEEPEVKAIHAGLECGIIAERYPEMDMISFGPTIQGAHSPDERINIKTVEKFWKLLEELLKAVPEK